MTIDDLTAEEIAIIKTYRTADKTGKSVLTYQARFIRTRSESDYAKLVFEQAKMVLSANNIIPFPAVACE